MSSRDPSFTVRDVLRETFGLIRARPVLLVGVAVLHAASAVLVLRAERYVFREMLRFRDGGDFRPAVSTGNFTFVAGFAIVIAFLALLDGVAAIAAVAHREGRDVSALDIVRTALRRVFKVALTIVAVRILVAAGLLFLIVPGLMALADFSLAPVAAANENVGPSVATRRAQELVDAERLRILSLLAIIWTPYAVVMVDTMRGRAMLIASLAFDLPCSTPFAVRAFVVIATPLVSAAALAVMYARRAATPAQPIDEITETFA